MLASGTILGSKWSLVSQIGEGACAKVYSISDVKSSLDYEVVAKVIPLAKSKSKKDKEQERICNTLNYEYILYTGLLMDFPYAPRRPAKFFGDDIPSGVRYLVMERLDYDLVGYIKHNPVTSSSIATLGLQMLEGLLWLHQKNFVFVDIKPENFMMKANKLFFVDFGLVERYIAQAGVNARAPGTRAAFAGTPTFCSLSVHRGGVPTGADDIESMGYVLLSLTSTGQMPWSGASSDAQCLQSKENCDIDALSAERGCPEVGHIITACRQLASGQAVDYAQCRQLLTEMRDRSQRGSKSSSAQKTSKSSASSSSAAEDEAPHVSVKVAASRKKAVVSQPRVFVLDDDEHDDKEDVASRSPAAKRARSGKTTIESVSVTAPLSGLPPSAVNVAITKTARSKATVSAVIAVAHSVAAPEGPFTLSSSSSPEQRRPVRARATRSSDASPLKVDTVPPSSSSSSSKSIAVPLFSPQATLLSDAPFSMPAAKRATPSAVSAASSASLHAVFWVSATSGPYSGRRFELGANDSARATQTVLGRGQSCGMSLPSDEYLSERHLTLKACKLGLYLQDNGSTNGTKVNGARIAIKEWLSLSSGDVVDAGETKLVVELC